MIPLLLFAVVAADFTGTWLYRIDGRNFMVLTLNKRGGTIRRPEQSRTDSEGNISNIGGGVSTLPVKWTKRARELTAGKDRYLFHLVDAGHATLADAEAPWATLPIERARPSDDLTVPSPWPQPQYPPEIVELRARLKKLLVADQAVRSGDRISPMAMLETDLKHRAEIERIVDRYGWPKRSLIGQDAAHDFWLLVQHQPLDLQQRVLPEMERAMRLGEASRAEYAFLYDRVRIGAGKPQRWGTQAKCINGLPVLSPVEDQAGLDERRRELRMPPMKEYLKGLKDMCRAMR